MAQIIILEWKESNDKLKDLFTVSQSYRSSSTDSSISIQGDTITATLPMIEDFTLDVKTNFKAASSVIQEFGGGIASLIQKMHTLQNVSAGTVSQSQNIWDLQIWDKTQPIRLDFEVMFYTKTEALVDVLAPIMSLLSLTVISEVQGSGGTLYRVPGVHAKNLYTVKKGKNKNKTEEDSEKSNAIDGSIAKIINITIPGAITLKDCILETAKPTFSKEITESGVPLWGKLQMGIQTIWPANDTMLLTEFTKLL